MSSKLIAEIRRLKEELINLKNINHDDTKNDKIIFLKGQIEGLYWCHMNLDV